MDFLVTYIYVPIVVLLLFGAAIFVHEWGHYIVARICGLKIEAFAIGFGKPIYAWTKNGIEYSIRWIPAGGYVKLPQMLTSEAIEGDNEGPREELPPVSPLAKIAVAFAGPFMNVVFAFVIATVIHLFGLPVKVNPSIIGYVDPESAEYDAGVRQHDRIVEVDGKSANSWEEVFNNVIGARTNVIKVVLDREGERHAVHLKAEKHEAIGLKMLNLNPQDRPVIQQVMDDSPAMAAGLKDEDRVLKFDGIQIAGRGQFIKEVQTRGGKECEIVVERDGKEVALTVTPKGAEKGPARIGVMIGEMKEVYVLQKPGPLPWVLINDEFGRIKFTIYALSHSKETGVGAKDLSGPVGILSVLATQVKADFRLALKFMILLNISLAVMNLLPIPVLDGGHIVMAIFEQLRGQPMGVRLQEYTTMAFAVLLISFMLYVTFHDVKRGGLFLQMFKQETEIIDDPNDASKDAKEAPATP
ncbi:MAG: RIP metalloprotease RseP [Verrucomicrobiales bacterium]|nr:RIP metalloprotease RseP [Verrucomicrobiales bacterium]|tara:strand:+ start:604 stop:2013 length:1410 start_codon:yes stop_codon:yes gene_type:complete